MVWVPLEEIIWQGLLGEPPVPVDGGGHLHGVLPRVHGPLQDAAGVEQYAPCQRVDLHRVLEVRLQELVDGVHGAQLPPGRDDERLHRRVREQPSFGHPCQCVELCSDAADYD